MKIICSWCKKFMGEKEPVEDSSETHAKCAACLRDQKGKEYVNSQGTLEYQVEGPGKIDGFEVVARPAKKRQKK